jgi:hypothetical protein
MLVIAFFTAFVFLEEIDYGAHFNELIYGTNTSYLGEITGYYNIHNEGNNARLFKRSVYLLMALIFITLPLFYYVDKLPDWLQYFIPHPKIIILALLTILVDITPRLLTWSGMVEDGGLGVNIGEFSEVMVYYIFLIYLHQLVIKQQEVK